MPSPNRPAVLNRIQAVMVHTSRYAFKGQARLADDAGVSRSAVCRLLSGKSSPTFQVLWKLTRALERATTRYLDPRELISIDGSYPTTSVCALTGCRGCLPSEAYDENDRLRPEYRHVRPGHWPPPERRRQPEEAA